MKHPKTVRFIQLGTANGFRLTFYCLLLSDYVS